MSIVFQQFLHITQRKKDISKLQACIYDGFDYIEKIYYVRGDNSYIKTFQQVRNKIYGIFRAYFQ